MKIEIVSGIVVIVSVVVFFLMVIVSIENDSHVKNRNNKLKTIKTEIPVQMIKCVKLGEKYCLEYQVFNEVRQ